jgi:RNA polymerase sigma-54 factor
MVLGPRLDLRQSQSLAMTPQLQQAIRLLALSNLEIESFIAEELARNPLLEISGSNDDETSIEPPEETGVSASNEPETVDILLQSGNAEQDAPLDIDYDSENFHQDSAADSVSDRGNISGGGEGADLDSFVAQEASLQDHLLAQAGARLAGTDFVIAGQIIEQLEETGYFYGSLSEIARRLGASPDDVEHILNIMQSFDPAGVAARSLAECLALQAKEANRYDPAMARLIDNLDYLAKGNLAALKRICGVDDEDLNDMIQELRAYDPKPGCKFLQGGRVDAITPDIFVSRRNQSWAIELNSATLPRLLVNRHYYTELAKGRQDKRAKAWLSECLTSANWLLKALDQRARTIIKVSTEIVKQQEAFFHKGIAHLRPLTLRAVADAIGMHESTVSRVTSNKYLACDRGLFELKYFFTSSIQSADGGDAISAEAVKSHIKALVASEGSNHILSDDELVDLLRAKGFDIARRTVAKYREALGIGSSVQRRRQKAMGSYYA